MIRRKVFSSYSEEDLISAIEERAFCEGYLAAQKEFGRAAEAVKGFKLGNQLEIARAQELERMIKKRPSLKTSLINIKNNTKRLLGLG